MQTCLRPFLLRLGVNDVTTGRELKQCDSIFSQCWRLDVGDRGAFRDVPFGACPLHLQMAIAWFVSSHGHPSACAA